MVWQHRVLIGLGVALLAAPALAQAPNSQPTPSYSSALGTCVTVAQATPPAQRSTATPVPTGSRISVPHRLAEALAATYSSQPVLQAERAKLRATDENVARALAGWRPTVIMAGSAGYGDGMSRQFTKSGNGGFPIARTDRGMPLYDETAYYNAVKDKWAGLGDYATDQPGR
jgi:outer membrane protein